MSAPLVYRFGKPGEHPQTMGRKWLYDGDDLEPHLVGVWPSGEQPGDMVMYVDEPGALRDRYHGTPIAALDIRSQDWQWSDVAVPSVPGVGDDDDTVYHGAPADVAREADADAHPWGEPGVVPFAIPGAYWMASPRGMARVWMSTDGRLTWSSDGARADLRGDERFRKRWTPDPPSDE